jgi:hypothetical protein
MRSVVSSDHDDRAATPRAQIATINQPLPDSCFVL